MSTKAYQNKQRYAVATCGLQPGDVVKIMRNPTAEELREWEYYDGRTVPP